MKISEVIKMNCTSPDKKEILKNTLLKTPFFKGKSPEDIHVEDLEYALRKIVSRYPITLGYVMPSFTSEEFHYAFMLKRSDTHQWLDTIYALDLFEGYAKSVLYAYAFTRKEKQHED